MRRRLSLPRRIVAASIAPASYWGIDIATDDMARVSSMEPFEIIESFGIFLRNARNHRIVILR
jgi:hypothetical protein